MSFTSNVICKKQYYFFLYFIFSLFIYLFTCYVFIYVVLISNVIDRFAGIDALRCLALAMKRMPPGLQALSYDDETDLTFIGLVLVFFVIAFRYE